MKPLRPWQRPRRQPTLTRTSHYRPCKVVEPALTEKLAKLRMAQLQGLIFVLPSRYEDRTQVSKTAACDLASRLVEGEIQLTEVAYRRRRQLLCRITDGTGS